jgi:sarcosine oxidase, subunit beta
MSHDLPRSVDVGIVGGGIMGTSIAWHLARRGVRVALFERSVVAAGASGRTGALLRQHYSNRPEATLAKESLTVFQNWSETVGGSCGYEPTGLLFLLPRDRHAEANLELLRTNVELARSLGIDTVALTPGQLRELQPDMSVDDLAGVAYEASTGCVDAVAATRGMAAAARRAGASVIEGITVLGIEAVGDRVTGLQTDRGTVAAGAVVCAAGPWSTRLLLAIGVDVPVTALRVQVVVVARPLELSQPHPAIIDVAGGMFCRPFGPGRSLVGVSGGDQHDPVDPERYVETNDPTYPDQAIGAIALRYPAMANAAFLSGHAGLYDMTPDAHPIIGSAGHAGPAGLYLALGFSGAGFKKGPAVGHCLAELIVEGCSTLLDLHPFRLDRFATDAWRLPWSESEYELESDFGHRF